MKYHNLRTKNRIPSISREEEKKDGALERLRIYQHEPWEPEDKGENNFQTSILYRGKISIKDKSRK